MMHKFLQPLEQPLRSATSLLEKKMMRDFAHKYDLVYFGTMSAQRDDYHVVRGVTLHTDHQDRHFIIGNYQGRDVTVLQRSVRLSHPHHGSRHYKWTIVQVDLNRRRLPHLLATAQRHDKVFFENLHIKLATFQQLNPQLIPNAAFARYFTVFAVTESLEEVPMVLTPDIMAAMVHYFRGFDVEMFEDSVVIYTSQQHVTSGLLQEMLREAVWLAKQLDQPLELPAQPQV